MAKLTLNDISNITGNPTSAEQSLNDNFTKIEEALENTFSLDGTAPNALEASLDANSHRIINLPYALSNTEPVTLAQLMALINGEDWTGVGIPAVVFYQDNEPTATAAGQVWVKPSDLSIWIWDGNSWIRQEDPNLQLAISIANDASAAVGALTPRVVAVEEDSANYNNAIIELEADVGNLAANIVSVTADLNDVSAVVQNEILARVQGDQALATAINSIQAFTNKIYVQATAPTDSPPGTLDEGDFWYDSDDGNHPYRWVSGAWVSVQDTSYTAPLYAAIESEETARIGGDTALANSILSLQAQREDDYALIVSNNLARIDAESVLASSINSVSANVTNLETDLDGQISSLSASVSNEISARISGDSANAASISSVSSIVNGHTTTINSHTSSINGILGRWTIQIDNNGYVSGVDLISAADKGTTPYSTFTVTANAFRIVSPGLNPVTPFQVVDGVTYIKDVRIDSAVIGTATIGTLNVAANAVSGAYSYYKDMNGGMVSAANNVWSYLTTPNGTVALTVPGLVVPGSTVYVRTYVNVMRAGSANESCVLRVRRNDGAILPGTPTLRLDATIKMYAWEFVDVSPIAVSHTYYLEVMSPDGGGGIGNWYDISMIAMVLKR